MFILTKLGAGNMKDIVKVKSSQPSVPFHIETFHLICTANQITGFYMKYNPALKRVKWDTLLKLSNCLITSIEKLSKEKGYSLFKKRYLNQATF